MYDRLTTAKIEFQKLKKAYWEHPERYSAFSNGLAVRHWEYAKRTAEIVNDWVSLDGTICTDEYDLRHCANTVRVRFDPDEYVSCEDLCGDCFNPDENPHLSKEALERKKREFLDTVNRDGVWGAIGEFWNGEEWIDADSIWGLVGLDEDDYILDIMASAIDGYRNVARCECCGRPKN